MLRHFRNIIIGLSLVFLTIGLCLYISAVMYILLVWGPEYVNFHALNPTVTDFPNRLWPTIFDYISHWMQNHESYPPLLEIKLFSSLLAPISVVLLALWNVRGTILEWRPFKKKESLHGDARWAEERDIRKVKLRNKVGDGLILGRDKRGFLVAGGYQHVLCFAPTGSGKGVSCVIPNLLTWKGSVVVHDIKLENYQLTSGWRKKQGQEVFCWSPADPDGVTHCYNPLDWISSKPGQMVDDVQKIANLLMPEQDFWVNEARSLFLGVVLYILADESKIKSFGEVVRVMRSDDVVYRLAVCLDTMGKQIHPVAYMNIAAFLQKAEKERSGVISTMNSSLELWANPLIDTATAFSDFNFMEMKKKLTTVYVGLTPDNLSRLQPLMQVFYQQATEFLCRHLPKDDEPYGVLFMMDEFPTLGEMEQFKTGIAYFRGYNVRLFLVVQDTEQLKGIYEEAGMNSFLSNSAYRLTFAANNINTANLISQMVGNKTVKQESLNAPKYFDINPGARSLHISDTQRALLLPQEVMTLPRDEQILLIESSPPIKSKKITYYKDKFFTSRLTDPVFVPTQEPFDPLKYSEQKAQEKLNEDFASAAAPELDKTALPGGPSSSSEAPLDQDLDHSVEENTEKALDEVAGKIYDNEEEDSLSDADHNDSYDDDDLLLDANDEDVYLEDLEDDLDEEEVKYEEKERQKKES